MGAVLAFLTPSKTVSSVRIESDQFLESSASLMAASKSSRDVARQENDEVSRISPRWYKEIFYRLTWCTRISWNHRRYIASPKGAWGWTSIMSRKVTKHIFLGYNLYSFIDYKREKGSALTTLISSVEEIPSPLSMRCWDFKRNVSVKQCHFELERTWRELITVTDNFGTT